MGESSRLIIIHMSNVAIEKGTRNGRGINCGFSFVGTISTPNVHHVSRVNIGTSEGPNVH